MLKIKDDVDLKELEKFGYEYRNCCEYIDCYVLEVNTDGWSNDEIIIYCNSREIHKSYEDFATDYLQKYIDYLIQAGLVEKVDDK